MQVETTTELTETVSVVKIQTVKELPSFYHLIAMGVAMLTAHYRGLHWVDYIEIDTLNMRFTNSCVVGQLEKKLGRMEISDMSVPFGFALSYETYPRTDYDQRQAGWDQLTNEWKDVLTKLKAERAKVKGKRKPKVAKPIASE